MFDVFPDESSIDEVPLIDTTIKGFLIAVAKLARNPGFTPQWQTFRLVAKLQVKAFM